jgi:mRNA interferase RelE/StbE
VSPQTFTIRWSETALRAIEEVKDLRIKRKLFDRAGELSIDPEKRGKLLEGELKGLWAVRAAGQRYRILFRIDKAKEIVLIVTLGMRRAGSKQDVYALAEKLIRQGLIKVRL